MERIQAEVDSDGDLMIIRETIYEKKFLFDCSLEWRERKKIKKVFFQNCCLNNFPNAEMLFKFVPNVNHLEISCSKLSRIRSQDLNGFGNLVELYLNDNDIHDLPGDLFIHTPNLEYTSFADNCIKVIGEGILDPLRNLKHFNLLRNPGIDIYYNKDIFGHSLAQFKDAIKRCAPVQEVWKIVDDQKKEIAELRTMNVNQNSKIVTLEGKIENLEKKLDEVKQAGAFSKLNFTVKVDGQEFKVQKEILIANSPLLAQMIEGNVGADTLELKDISEENFREILNYMTDKSPPKPTANLIDLYAESGRLQMRELMDVCAQMLMERVTPENSVEILSLCKKYPNIELQKKAHAEYGKSLDN